MAQQEERHNNADDTHNFNVLIMNFMNFICRTNSKQMILNCVVNDWCNENTVLLLYVKLKMF